MLHTWPTRVDLQHGKSLEEYMKITYAHSIYLYTFGTACVCGSLWLFICLFYSGILGMDPSGFPYHRLEVSVFVTFAFHTFCAGNCKIFIASKQYGDWLLTFSLIFSKRRNPIKPNLFGWIFDTFQWFSKSNKYKPHTIEGKMWR